MMTSKEKWATILGKVLAYLMFASIGAIIIFIIIPFVIVFFGKGMLFMVHWWDKILW